MSTKDGTVLFMQDTLPCNAREDGLYSSRDLRGCDDTPRLLRTEKDVAFAMHDRTRSCSLRLYLSRLRALPLLLALMQSSVSWWWPFNCQHLCLQYLPRLMSRC